MQWSDGVDSGGVSEIQSIKELAKAAEQTVANPQWQAAHGQSLCSIHHTTSQLLPRCATSCFACASQTRLRSSELQAKTKWLLPSTDETPLGSCRQLLTAQLLTGTTHAGFKFGVSYALCCSSSLKTTNTAPKKTLPNTCPAIAVRKILF